MSDDPVNMFRRNRPAFNQDRDKFRTRSDFGPLVERLERERDAYQATATAYAESEDRSDREVARTVEQIAAVLTSTIDELDVILANAGNVAWDWS
jgi:hypothetical protein